MPLVISHKKNSYEFTGYSKKFKLNKYSPVLKNKVIFHFGAYMEYYIPNELL